DLTRARRLRRSAAANRQALSDATGTPRRPPDGPRAPTCPCPPLGRTASRPAGRPPPPWSPPTPPPGRQRPPNAVGSTADPARFPLPIRRSSGHLVVENVATRRRQHTGGRP